MKDSLLTTHMYWSALHCIVELHLSGLHREKCTKKLLVVCCSFLLLAQTQADWQTMSAETDVLRQDPWRIHDVWREYKKDSTDSDGG